MAYSWDNRVKFVVRYMYDIDNNGFLDKNDFECLAVRNTVIEGKGNWDEATFKKNQEIMANLWNEIADLADFNKVCDVVTFFLVFRSFKRKEKKMFFKYFDAGGPYYWHY